MVYCKVLNIVPCVMQQDFVVYFIYSSCLIYPSPTLSPLW